MKSIFILNCLVVIALNVGAGIQEVVFIGITGDGAPAIENTFEVQLRKRLSTQTSLYLADCIVSQRYAKMIKFNDFSMVSRELVESIESFATDTTLFIWGTVKKCRVNAIQKSLFRKVVKGELEINLTVYSLDTKGYSYSGIIYADVLKPGEFSFVSDKKERLHIDAVKRQEVLEECIDKAVTKTTAMINALVQRNVGEKEVVTENAEDNKTPSIYDVFSVPSVNAPGIEDQLNSTPKSGGESK